MSLEEICKKIIKKRENADHKEACEGSVDDEKYFENYQEYAGLAIDYANRLARAVLVLRSALKEYTDKEMFEQGHGLGFHEDAIRALAEVEKLMEKNENTS